MGDALKSCTHCYGRSANDRCLNCGAYLPRTTPPEADVTAREAVEIWMRPAVGWVRCKDDAEDDDRNPLYVRLRDYRTLLARAEAAYRAGQEDMRERAIKAIDGSRSLSHPDDYDAGLDEAQAAIHALTLKDRPE